MQRIVHGQAGAKQDPVVAGHAEQPKAHHEHAGDGAAAEGDVQGLAHALVGRLRGAHIRAHGDVHADVAGGSGEHRADQKTDGRGPAQGKAENDQDDCANYADGGVLTIQVGVCTFLDRPGDLLHACVACRLCQDPAHLDRTKKNREQARTNTQ